MLRLLFFLVSVLILSRTEAQKPTLDEASIQNIQKRLEFGLNPAIVIGMINEDGTAVYAFGKNETGGKNASAQSVFEIGSISKTFTSLLLADQVTKGKMKLDDPVQMYLPGHVRMPSINGEEITLGHLADHTSSLSRMPSNFDPADPLNPYADYTRERMYDFLNHDTLHRAIGSAYEYSNLAMGLLGHVLELHTGKSYEELLSTVITRPLGMDMTGVALNKNMQKNLAPGHSQGSPVPNWDLNVLTGAGGIRSTIEDMLVYLKANMWPDQTPLRDAIELTQQIRHDKADEGGVGLGWHMGAFEGVDFIHHGGATGGYRAFTGFRKDRSLGVVVLTNSDEAADEIALHLLHPASPLTNPSPSLAQYMGDIMEKEGPENFVTKIDAAVAANSYRIEEDVINQLGYYYMGLKKWKEAESVFEWNMHAHPHSFNVYDSYAESLMESGQDALAIFYYKKSLELNPGNTNGIDMLHRLGVTYEVPVVNLSTSALDRLTGVYQYTEGYTMTISRKDLQLFGQITGQDAYPVFPKSETEFYFKIVPATIKFDVTDDHATKVTLYQNGRELEWKLIQ